VKVKLRGEIVTMESQIVIIYLICCVRKARSRRRIIRKY